MDIERQFEDLGVNAVTGIQLMRTLNLNPEDFYDGATFMRFKDIINFFKDIPDRDYILNMITIGKNVDKVTHVWGYTQLMEQKRKQREELEKEQKKFDLMDGIDDEILLKEQENTINSHKVELLKTERQINMYEL